MPTERLAAPSGRPRNAILSQLPDNEYAPLAKQMVPVDLPLGMQLSEPNRPIEYCYFPNRGLISTDAMTRDGESVEVGVTGREGFSGLPALLNQPQMSHMVVIQGVGSGIRIHAEAVRQEFLKGGMLQTLVYSFAYLQMVQMTQSVLCNRLHQVDARLARWLLTSADRTESESLNLTHQFLAQMLGVQRSTVTIAAGDFQRAGLISYSRGKLEILNRRKLAEVACECYEVVCASYGRMLQVSKDKSLCYVV